MPCNTYVGQAKVNLAAVKFAEKLNRPLLESVGPLVLHAAKAYGTLLNQCLQEGRRSAELSWTSRPVAMARCLILSAVVVVSLGHVSVHSRLSRDVSQGGISSQLGFHSPRDGGTRAPVTGHPDRSPRQGEFRLTRQRFEGSRSGPEKFNRGLPARRLAQGQTCLTQGCPLFATLRRPCASRTV